MKRKIAFLMTIIMTVTIIGIHAQASSAPIGSLEWAVENYGPEWLEEHDGLKYYADHFGLECVERLCGSKWLEENYGPDWKYTIRGIPAPTPTPEPTPVVTAPPLKGMTEDEILEILNNDPYLQAQTEELNAWLAEITEEPGESNTDIGNTPPAAETVTPVSTNKHYDDVPSNAWYAEAVNAMTEGGLLKGYDDGLFHPTDTVKQGEFATILCRMMGLSETYPGIDDPRWYITTSDTWFGTRTITSKTHWAQDAIINLSVTGIYVISKGAETADDPVWRADALDAMVETAHWTKYDSKGRFWFEHNHIVNPTEKVWTQDDIPDWDAVAYDDLVRTREMNAKSLITGVCRIDMKYAGHLWNSRFILDAYNLGFTKGIDEAGTCNPEGELTRAELAQMLYNAGWVKYGCATKH